MTARGAASRERGEPAPTALPLDPADWLRLEAVLPDALDLPASERAAFLDRAFAGPDGARDTALRREADLLLAAFDAAEASDALVSPFDGLLEEALDDDALPGQVGPWRPTARLGAGGMGVVYAAERADASFQQRAALKLVRPGFGADFRARFVHERAVLAGLEHENVARLLDGGVTADGLPYLAMECVDGVPITDYAEHHALSVAARLALFLQVCDAVAYAHRRFVVHRDLKPSNVLVSDAGRVKLLDFGIAKLLDAPDGALQTRTGAAPLTPQYAAPEQLLGRAVTTATDVYALGLVLYELLAGRRPYTLATQTAAEAERTVCHTLPPPPSAVAPPARARRLRGDLDRIVARALAKDPERRYPGAEALAADLGRLRDGLPVEAQPDALAYRVRLFVRRHRAAVAAVAAVVGIAAALTGFYTLRLAAERDLARAEADRAAAVAGFLEQILRAPNPSWYVNLGAKGPDTPIRDVLDEAARRVDRDFAGRPELLADLHHILGDTYAGMGLGDEGLRHHRRVLALRESLYTAPDPRLAEAYFYVGSFLAESTPRQSVTYLERALAMQRARPEGNNFPFIVEGLAIHYRDAGRYAEAAALYAEGIRFAETRFTPGHEGVRYRDHILAVLGNHRAHALTALGRLDAAERQLDAVDSLVARLPPADGDRAGLWHGRTCGRGRLLRDRRRFAEAEPLLRACAGDRSPRAAPAPPTGEDASEAEVLSQRLEGSAELVALYDAWGRPGEAAPFRADGARYDSLAAARRAALALPGSRRPGGQTQVAPRRRRAGRSAGVASRKTG